MLRDPGSVEHADPVAFFITWTTFGSWLPGDVRGWADSRGVMHLPAERLRASVARRLAQSAVTLTVADRGAVRQSIETLCRIRGWHLHAVNCRLQHVHVVITASGRMPEAVMQQLKMWASRGLEAVVDESRGSRRSQHRWWTRGGSLRRVFGERDLEAVVTYVRECQDKGRRE
ncbi:MAG: transposase [Pirellulales bacterium]